MQPSTQPASTRISCASPWVLRKLPRLCVLWMCGLAVHSSCLNERSPGAIASSESAKRPGAKKAPHASKGEAGPKEPPEDPVDLIVDEKEPPPKIEPTVPEVDALDQRPEIIEEAESRLTRRYRERLLELEEEHARLKRKDSEINSATKQMLAKLENLTALEDRLQRELGIGKARREFRDQRTTALASLMMTMPPQSGARILSNMSEQDAQDIVLAVAQKNERKAAKILAQMPPERVASLSQRYLSAKRKIKDTKGLLPPTTATTPPSK